MRIEESDKVRVALPLEDPEEQQRLEESCQFQDDHFVITGYPVRPAFQDASQDAVAEQVETFQAEYGINQNDRVILISMGAQGGPKLAEYCAQIANMDFPDYDTVHVFALCAKSKILQDTVLNIAETIPENKNIKMHMVNWVNGDVAMAAYIKMADVYITKPGGGSTSEGWAMGTYLLFNGEDAKSTPWEPANMQKVIDRRIGAEISQNFEEQLLAILSSPAPNLEEDFPGRKFATNILRLAHELAPPKPSSSEDDSYANPSSSSESSLEAIN